MTDKTGVFRDLSDFANIEASVSGERFARLFSREVERWHATYYFQSLIEFRSHVMFAGPPISELEFIFCHGLHISPKPLVQKQLAAKFRFALRPRGILISGGTENLAIRDPCFVVVVKSGLIWQRNVADAPGNADASPAPFSTSRRPATRLRPGRLAQSDQVAMLQHPSPTAMLVDAQGHCLNAIGPTERYPPHASDAANRKHLALRPPASRAGLYATAEEARTLGKAHRHHATKMPYLDICPVGDECEELLQVRSRAPSPITAAAPTHVNERARGMARIVNLERDLEIMRAELYAATHDLRRAAEELCAVNDEHQSMHDRLSSAIEKKETLNRDLILQIGQLNEILDHRQTTSNVLRNIIYGMQQATICLDLEMRVRFYTPVAREVFRLLPGDIGRPLSDLRSLANDPKLAEDAMAVLTGAPSRVAEIATVSGGWFDRSVRPLLGEAGTAEGVVINFVDIAARREMKEALRHAEHHADFANAAGSRLLHAASHDLRQPLQTLTLLRDRLATVVEGEEARKLVALQEPTLAAISGMLDTLVEINRPETGSQRAVTVSIAIGPLIERLRDEFAYPASGQGIDLRLVACSLTVKSDPRLLEQILRILLRMALKSTRGERILLGCRRGSSGLRIEVRDTGIGIPEPHGKSGLDDLHLFDEQVRIGEGSQAFGPFGVQRLASLPGHRLDVRTTPAHGSVFAVTVPLCPPDHAMAVSAGFAKSRHRNATILVVEDDPGERTMLVRILTADGHTPITASDGEAALALVARGAIRPEIVLADFELPKGMSGLRLGEMLRERLGIMVPIIILTAHISTETQREIAGLSCEKLHKPVRALDLSVLIQRLLGDVPPAPSRCSTTTIHVVEDDASACAVLMRVLGRDGQVVVGHASAEAFLESYRTGGNACLLVDAQLPGMNGFDLITRLRQSGDRLPAIMVTGFSDVGAAVRAMKCGASDFIEKPVRLATLRAALDCALERSRDLGERDEWRRKAADSLASLTPRQREVMMRVLAGEPSKNIAVDLGISQRTVETHRAEIMRRTGTKSLPALARLALAAEPGAD